MINIEITDELPESEPVKPEMPKPDDTSGMIVQGFFKISDPETGEIYTQGRA